MSSGNPARIQYILGKRRDCFPYGVGVVGLLVTGRGLSCVSGRCGSGRPGSVFACLRVVGWSRGQVWCGDAAPLCGRRAVAAWYLLAG